MQILVSIPADKLGFVSPKAILCYDCWGKLFSGADGYVEALAQNFYGIKDIELIKAVGLDVEGAQIEKILLDCEEEIVRRFQT